MPPSLAISVMVVVDQGPIEKFPSSALIDLTIPALAVACYPLITAATVPLSTSEQSM